MHWEIFIRILPVLGNRYCKNVNVGFICVNVVKQSGKYPDPRFEPRSPDTNLNGTGPQKSKKKKMFK